MRNLRGRTPKSWGRRITHRARVLRGIGSVTLVPILVFYSPDAHSQDIERARQLFDEATTLRESGNYADAVVRLKLAIAIKDTPGLEYHAGFCEARLGHYTTAIQHYERAAALIRAGVNAPDVAALLNQAHKEATRHIAHVHVSLTNPVRDATLQIDDAAGQALTREDLPLDPGTHHLRVRAPGYSPEERDIALRDAEELQVELRLQPLEKKQVTSRAPSAESLRWKTVSIGAGLGLTALGFTTGIVAAIGYNNASVSERAALAAGDAQMARLAAARHDKQTYSTWETIGFVTGGVGAITTLAVWALWPSSQKVSVATSASGGVLGATVTLTSSF